MKKDKNPIKKVLKKAPEPKPMKRMMLPEVRVTAPRIRKVVEESVGLYPKGMASKRSVDSLKRVGFGNRYERIAQAKTGNLCCHNNEASPSGFQIVENAMIQCLVG